MLDKELFLKIASDQLLIRINSGYPNEVPFPMINAVIYNMVSGVLYRISYSAPIFPGKFHDYWNFHFETIRLDTINSMLDNWSRLYPGWVQRKPMACFETYDGEIQSVGYEDVSHLVFFSRIHALLIEEIRSKYKDDKDKPLIFFNRFDSFYRKLEKKVYNTFK